MAIKWPSQHQEFVAWGEMLVKLFAGRRDVAARYFEFARHGQTVRGWRPWLGQRVAADYEARPGERVEDVARGDGVERRVLKAFSAENLVRHLRGRDRLGVYVLDSESRVKFLAADFDDHAGALDPAGVWAEVRRFVETCETHDWLCHVERSKSGRGYHVWLFFDAPVAAGKARAVGKWLFEESQLLREGEDFSTFDRFFPAQSELAPNLKGYGNLIALPCCGPQEYAAGRAAWVDDQGAVRQDPLTFMRWLVADGRNPAARVDQFMAEWDLQPDVRAQEARREDDGARDLGTQAELEQVLSRCAFMQWASAEANQAAVAEPLWFAMISNAARFSADEWIHAASCHHGGYSPGETDKKIAHARGGPGPQTCSMIRQGGFKGCPAEGCKLPAGRATAAPAGLAAWAHPRHRAEVKRGPRDRSASIRPDDLPAQPTPGRRPAQEEPNPGDVDWGGLPLRPETGRPWPELFGPWKMGGFGVEDSRKDDQITLRPIWVEALTENSYGQQGLYVAFFNQDWRPMKQALPLRRLHEQGGVLSSDLADCGFFTVPGKEKMMSRFLIMQAAVCKERMIATSRLGWLETERNQPVFCLPEQVVGEAPYPIVYQPDAVNVLLLSRTLHRRNSLQAWQRSVADLCRGNPLLMFAVMTGLAGPLLWFLEEQSGGFHFYGTTTGGKTTAAQAAASVWGSGADPQAGPEYTSIRKWNATAAALEGMAEMHNHMVLCLDEISEIDPQELGRTIYQLAGGISKGRGQAHGGLRAWKTWRFLFLSTGEKSVAQLLQQVGQQHKGGQRVRLPDIPVDNADGSRATVLDDHGLGARGLADALKSGCAANYGLAGPVLVAHLIHQVQRQGMAAVNSQLRDELATWEAKLAEGLGQLPPEGQRVLRRFGVVGLAGVRAAAAGILDWSTEEILRAVAFVRDRWLAEQGDERSELQRALVHFRQELLSHMFQFQDVEYKGRVNAAEIMGFSAPEWFMLTPKGLRSLCGEYDSTLVLHALKAGDYLWHEADRLTRKAPRIESLGRSRPYLYWVDKRFLGEYSDGWTAEDAAAGLKQGGGSD